MRGVQLLDDRQCRLIEADDPRPGDGQVVVALRAAATCVSNLHPYRDDVQEQTPRRRRFPDTKRRASSSRLAPKFAASDPATGPLCTTCRVAHIVGLVRRRS